MSFCLSGTLFRSIRLRISSNCFVCRFATSDGSTPTKKEVSRINVLVLNAGPRSFKYGLFSIASRPAGHDWLQKDSFLLASGTDQVFCSLTEDCLIPPCVGLIDNIGGVDKPIVVSAHVLGRAPVVVRRG